MNEELYASQETDGIPDNADEDSCEDEPDILLSEVTNAIQHLKNNKSPGPDEIPAELIKYADESGAKVIQHLCNRIWKTKKRWPADWKNSTFLTLPKKGDVSKCKNNRTIALISHLSKILLHIINERLRPILDRELPAEQAGFRRGRGTRDQISNIRHILEIAQNLTGRSISASLTMPRPLTASGIVHCGRLCLRWMYQHTL